MSDIEDEIIEMHRYLFPEMHVASENPVTDHPFWTPDDECFEWSAQTIETIADMVNDLFNQVKRDRARWRPAQWAEPLLEVVLDRIDSMYPDSVVLATPLKDELMNWWQKVEDEGDWDRFGGPFADKIEAAFFNEREG